MRSESGQDAVEIGFSSIDEITVLGGPFLLVHGDFHLVWTNNMAILWTKKNVTTGHQMPLGLPGVVGKFTQHKWKMWSSAICESTTRKNKKETWQCHSDLFGMHPRKYRQLVFGRFYGETQLMEMNVATATELPGGGFLWTQRLWTWPPRIKDWGWKRSRIESLGRFIFCHMKSLLVHMGVPTNRYLNTSLIGAGIRYPFFKFKHRPPPPQQLHCFGWCVSDVFLIPCSPLFSKKSWNFMALSYVFHVLIGNDSVFKHFLPDPYGFKHS